ncbi:MAG: hydrogenase iron-sulfur subunit [Methanomassiliicoccales archaeon]|nr:MAG: hydrogenase iron-sulfur subunit [Methanomassiliicoccales archaeon]
MSEEQVSHEGFEPKIIAFLCNWCSYAGADLAGVSRYQYPTNTRTVRVMCSSRVDPALILEMFIHGADGVLVGGCHLGDCHYITGNYYTEKKVKLVKKLMEKAGMEVQRLRLEWVSASEGERFSKVVADFVNEIKSLGPSPLAGDKPDEQKLEGLYVATNAARDFRLRSLVAREINLTEKGNVYDKKISQEEFDNLMDTAIEEEMARQKILFTTMDKPFSVLDIASQVNLSPQKVLEHIVTLKDRGLIVVDRYEGVMPLYVAPKEEVLR